MWHVMQVRSRKEKEIVDLVRKSPVGSYTGECFLPRYERKRRYRGAWKMEQAILFPGYVFVETEHIEELFFALKTIPELTKILRAEDVWMPLGEPEEEFLKRLMGPEKVVKFSKGIIVGDQVIIQEGPMQGLEGLIRKIDRHKRTATIEVEMFMRRMEVSIGLEIVEKRQGGEYLEIIEKPAAGGNPAQKEKPAAAGNPAPGNAQEAASPAQAEPPQE